MLMECYENGRLKLAKLCSLKTTIEEDVLKHIRESKILKEAWDTFSKLFSKKNDTELQLIENPEAPIVEVRMKKIIIHGVKPEIRSFVAVVQGWPTQPSLAGQEALAKQMGGVSLNNDEEALYANKGRRNS
ncbi:UNVERIFIED_CONTAM: hypothetical protein Slati_0948000 [Sesamum latifolium]|uniref:Uncharacterized protein n=1 Tax=Sesamum latifolium TaxID=2727402 RepID=A0AAW2XPL0_9LAMI